MPKKPMGEYAGKTAVFSTRIRPDLRAKLEEAATASGRSISQEVEHRLRRSFVEDDKIVDAFGDRRTFRLMRMMADAIHLAGEHEGGHWLDNPYNFEVALASALEVLEAIRPEGSSEWTDNVFAGVNVQIAARNISSTIWRGIKQARVDLPINEGRSEDHRRANTKSDLGPLAEKARPWFERSEEDDDL